MVQSRTELYGVVQSPTELYVQNPTKLYGIVQVRSCTVVESYRVVRSCT